MADWRQIQARIRKAKAAPEPAAQLTELFERTRDGMVAFELAKFREKAGEMPEAIQWYTTAAERFRRPLWRTKAEEALTRLGAPIPTLSSLPGSVTSPPAAGGAENAEAGQFAAREESPSALSALTSEESAVVPAAEMQTGIENENGSTPASAGGVGEPIKRRRHRGHRGGRGRRRGKKVPLTEAASKIAAPAAHTQSAITPSSEIAAPLAPAPPAVRPFEHRPARKPFERGRGSRREDLPLRPPQRDATERVPSLESPPGPIGWQVRGRAGDPALVSRMSHLESQLRRLLACTLYKMDDADQAPAGPGVFLVTDSDQTSYYHVEACQTLRIGIANQLRADRRAPRGADTLKSKFADHLGISESQVAKYLEQHCAVRWLQLDEGAPALAHFAIAVLKPVLDHE